MVVGEADLKLWPPNSIALSSDAPTAVIDRLQTNHVLRIAISRNRHMRRLQRR